MTLEKRTIEIAPGHTIETEVVPRSTDMNDPVYQHALRQAVEKFMKDCSARSHLGGQMEKHDGVWTLPTFDGKRWLTTQLNGREVIAPATMGLTGFSEEFYEPGMEGYQREYLRMSTDSRVGIYFLKGYFYYAFAAANLTPEAFDAAVSADPMLGSQTRSRFAPVLTSPMPFPS